MVEQTELLLKQLKLPAFVRYYQESWQQAADQGWSHPQYLTHLCEKELADRYQRRVKNWTKEARFSMQAFPGSRISPATSAG